MTWTTELPTTPGWYWVKGDDSMLICNVHPRYNGKVVMIGNFDYEEIPRSSLSFGVQFQSVKPPEEES